MKVKAGRGRRTRLIKRRENKYECKGKQQGIEGGSVLKAQHKGHHEACCSGSCQNQHRSEGGLGGCSSESIYHSTYIMVQSLSLQAELRGGGVHKL